MGIYFAIGIEDVYARILEGLGIGFLVGELLALSVSGVSFFGKEGPHSLPNKKRLVYAFGGIYFATIVFVVTFYPEFSVIFFILFSLLFVILQYLYHSLIARLNIK